MTIKHISLNNLTQRENLLLNPCCKKITWSFWKKAWLEIKRYLYFLKTFLAFSACQASDAERNNDDFCRRSSSKRRLSTLTQMEDFNCVVTEKNKVRHSTKSKLKILFFGNIWGKKFELKFESLFVLWAEIFPDFKGKNRQGCRNCIQVVWRKVMEEKEMKRNWNV